MGTGLDVQDVVKAFGRRRIRANDGLSLTARPGEIVGVLGPNGAGKTTLVRQVLGLVKPDAGSIRIDGVDIVDEPAAAKRLCSYEPQTPLPMTGLKPRRAIELTARLRGVERREARRRAADLLERLDLGEIANRPMQNVSGGTARLVAFAMAAAAPGSVVVLDEPTNDVDPLRRRTLWEIVTEMAERGSAVLLVTHNVHEAERAVDRVAIIDAGRVVLDGHPRELHERLGPSASLEDVYVSAVRVAR